MSRKYRLLAAITSACFYSLAYMSALASEIPQPLEADLKSGTMLVAHQTPVLIHAGSADINIAAGAIAYLIKLNDEVAILTLDNVHDRDVRIQVCGNEIAVPLGQQLILAPVQKDFEKTLLSQFAKSSNPKRLDSCQQINVFRADFSYLSALDNCSQFQRFLSSTAEAENKIARILIKRAAAFSAVGNN